MKKLIFLMCILMIGCHSMTAEEVTEVRDNAAAGDNVQKNWNTMTDDEKKQFVFAFTRTCYDILETTQGEPVPPAYVSSQ